MTGEPRPLQAGKVLADRFEVLRVLGRGGFGIAYLTRDLHRNDQVVVKELAPAGVSRDAEELIHLDSLHSGPRLRQRFLEEARLLSRLSVRGVLPVRAAFSELGTAYYVTDYLQDAVTLERLSITEGRMDISGALDILYQLLETLEGIHAKGVLHRDIKPSNVLVSPKMEAFLIDFGSAREWHADSSTHHTVLYTPGYAPLEQMSERARRGPATDLYSLCATAYYMLTGAIPTPAPERVSGSPLIPLRSIRPDVELAVANAIEQGLAIRYGDRPQSVQEFRELLAKEQGTPSGNTLLDYDAKLARLQKFTFERRQCPACRGLLEDARPLRKGQCPVCRLGQIRSRQILESLCPVCTSSPLRRHQNTSPPQTCPLCQLGWLEHRKKGLLRGNFSSHCDSCEAVFETKGDSVKLVEAGSSNSEEGAERTWREWMAGSTRSEEVWRCDGCGAQLDLEHDGRLRQIKPVPKKFESLYPDEWARVASGLPPGAGNAECTSCSADYFVEDDQVTLLAANDDPYGFAALHLGRLLTFEDLRWLGVGKESPNAGFVCANCGTEFDRENNYLRLVHSPNRELSKRRGEPMKLEDWHRVAEGLPTIVEERAFSDGLTDTLRAAYENGDVGFDNENTVLWKGPAKRLDEAGHGTLTISHDDVTLGGMIKRWRVPFDAVLGATAAINELHLELSGEPEPVVIEVEPVELVAHLTSGNRSVELGAESLAKRIRAAKS